MAGYYVLLTAPADYAAADQWFHRGKVDDLANAKERFRQLVDVDLEDGIPPGFAWRLKHVQDSLGRTLIHLRRTPGGVRRQRRTTNSTASSVRRPAKFKGHNRGRVACPYMQPCLSGEDRG